MHKNKIIAGAVAISSMLPSIALAQAIDYSQTGWDRSMMGFMVWPSASGLGAAPVGWWIMAILMWFMMILWTVISALAVVYLWVAIKKSLKK